MLLVLTVYLVNRESAASVASNAETSIVADNALSAVASVRTATSYALVLASMAGDSGASQGAFDGFEEASSDLLGRIGRLASEVDGTQADQLSRQVTAFVDATDFALRAMKDGQLEDAAGWVDEQATALGPLTSTLTAIRDDRIEQVLVAGEGVGRAAEAVRFLVLFFLPVAVMFIAWRAQRRNSERRRLLEEVENHRQIIKSKDDFVADVSHELRTPLTGIYGFASALEENGQDLSEFERELVGLIVNESVELSRMVDDLVAIGRISAGSVSYSFERVDVADEIEEVLKPLRRRGISIEHEPVGISVYADRARFRQLLRNLVSNAVKYGGDQIAVKVWRRGEETIIEVIDDGPGVPPAVEARLFERYVHSGGSALLAGSIGLGLAIARSFAEGMEGELAYVREDGLTMFRVSLPSHPHVGVEPARAQAALQS